MRLALDCQDDCECVGRQISRRAFAGCMNELGSLCPSWEIPPNDAVVRPTGVEPAGPEVLTLRLRPLGQTRMRF